VDFHSEKTGALVRLSAISYTAPRSETQRITFAGPRYAQSFSGVVFARIDISICVEFLLHEGRQLDNGLKFFAVRVHGQPPLPGCL
jgi:hypothetical protein